MMNGYHNMSKSHALNQLNKTVYLPETRLGIGQGENLAPLPNIVEYPHIMKQPTVPDLSTSSIEQATIDGQGKIFSEEDFPKTHFIGDTIGGF
jgi:hypothetical protein